MKLIIGLIVLVAMIKADIVQDNLKVAQYKTFLSSLSNNQIRSQDLSCSECFQQNAMNTYCLLGQDMFTGYCCDDEADKFSGCKKVTNTSLFCSESAIAPTSVSITTEIATYR